MDSGHESGGSGQIDPYKKGRIMGQPLFSFKKKKKKLISGENFQV